MLKAWRDQLNQDMLKFEEKMFYEEKQLLTSNDVNQLEYLFNRKQLEIEQMEK